MFEDKTDVCIKFCLDVRESVRICWCALWQEEWYQRLEESIAEVCCLFAALTETGSTNPEPIISTDPESVCLQNLLGFQDSWILTKDWALQKEEGVEWAQVIDNRGLSVEANMKMTKSIALSSIWQVNSSSPVTLNRLAKQFCKIQRINISPS